MFPIKFSILFFCVLFFLTACKKDRQINDTTDPPATLTPVPTDSSSATKKLSAVVFDFKAFVDNKKLDANSYYLNIADSFQLIQFNYYISNIQLKRADGTIYAERDSYHLNKHLEGKETFTMNGLPEGTYTEMEFIIGVDSAKSVSGVHNGDLAIEQGMFWDWNTGYVFFKIEGICRIGSEPVWENFGAHIGGFTEADNSLKKCRFVFNDPLIAKDGKPCGVFYHVNLMEVFKNPNTIDFQSLSVQGFKLFPAMVENYSDMFKIDRSTNSY
jgi:hypothetical protein